MRGFRQFAVTITIDDPIQYASSNENAFIMNILNKMTDTCYQGSLITKIITIDSVSNIMILNTNMTCNGNIDVLFTAEISKLSVGDVITNVEIVEVDRVILGIKYENKTRTVVAFKFTGDIYRRGQRVPGKIIAADYITNTHDVSFVCLPLLPRTETTAFIINGILSEDDKLQLDKLFYDPIKVALTYRNELMQNDQTNQMIIKFEQLLYAKRVKQKSSKLDFVVHLDTIDWTGINVNLDRSITTSIVNLDALIKMDEFSGVITRDVNLPYSMPAACIYDKAPTGITPIQGSALYILSIICGDILNAINTINELATQYDDQSFKTNDNIWLYMESNKIK